MLLVAPRSSVTSSVKTYSPACTAGSITSAAFELVTDVSLASKDSFALLHEYMVRYPFSESELKDPLRISKRSEGTIGASRNRRRAPSVTLSELERDSVKRRPSSPTTRASASYHVAAAIGASCIFSEYSSAAEQMEVEYVLNSVEATSSLDAQS